MKKTVSVIIPVFNASNYLKDCINSIISQTLKDIEIICINDCSTDNSLEILKEYSLKDERIKIIDLKQNKGVSNARNLGLDLSTGEYIYLIDSDDWIDKTYIEESVKLIKQTDSNVVINANFVNEYSDRTKKTYSKFTFLKKDFEIVDSKKIQNLFPPVVWTRLYKRAYIEQYKLRFPNVKCGAEDIYFSYAGDLMNQKICIFKGPYYHYCQHGDSAMHKKHRGYHYIESFKLLYEFLKEHNINLNGIKLFFVESLIIDNKDKFDFVKEYLTQIEQQFNENRDIYNEQEKFLFEIIKESSDFSMFVSKYNPNISLSFLKSKLSAQKR